MTGALAGLKVTVVGIYYAPDSTGIAPYTTDLCETLAANGASVHAIVGVPHYPQWKVDSGYRKGLRYREVRNGVRLTRIRHFVPRRQDILRRGLYELTFGAGAAVASSGDNPDLVVGVTPNLAGAAAAGRLARRQDVPLGLIVQDLVGLGARQSGIRGGAGVADRIARVEASVLRRADQIGVITEAFRQPLLDSGVEPGRVNLIPNYVRVTPSTADRRTARRLLGWPIDRSIALHAGNMGLKQGLHTVVEAARLADQAMPPVSFVMLGDGSTRRNLERLAVGIDSIRFVDPLPDEVFPLALAAADCLLINERSSVVDMSMPSKLTSYLTAGRPVVAATAPTGATARELLSSGAGVLVRPGNPHELLRAVQILLQDGEAASALGRAGRSYAEAWLSRDTAQDRIVDFISKIASLSPHAPGKTR